MGSGSRRAQTHWRRWQEINGARPHVSGGAKETERHDESALGGTQEIAKVITTK